jgi:DNA polymerase/3'-5' exonuclease PolX
MQRPAETRRTPLLHARRTAEEVLDALAPWVDRAEIAGSIRRERPEVKDIEVVAIPSEVRDGLFGEPRLAVQELRSVAEGIGPLVRGGEKYIQVTDVFGSGLSLDLFLVTPPATWGANYAIRTGPAEVSKLAVSRIKGRLWRCKDLQVTDDRGHPVPTATERQFFGAAQLPYLPAPERTLARYLEAIQ